MTRGMVAVVAVRAQALSEALGVVLAAAQREALLGAALDYASWQAQRLESACTKALTGGRPRDPRTGER